MSDTLYLALLRGINVGGNNIIRMVALKACFEEMEFGDVTTYIQSGNVIFRSKETDVETLAKRIERMLAKYFDYESRIVLLTQKQLQHAVEHAPKSFGKDPAKYRYDVIFLRKPLTAKEAMKSVSVKEGVDEVYAGKDVIYFSRLISRITSSHISRIVGQPVYKNMTIRNWNTTTRLLAMMNGV